MLKKFQDIFQDKRIFITGHTGFKGSWLTSWLLNLEANIIGFSDKIPTKPSMFNILDLKEFVTDIKGDIRNYNSINDSVSKYNPDIIFHLAAQPLVRKSYKNPIETYQTNIMGTVNLLDSLKNLNKSNKNENKVLLNVTSDKCYENKEQDYAYKENDPLGGYDPYSSSKACSEIVTSAYRRSFFNEDSKISIATARAGNVIGGGDWSEDRLVVDCIKALNNEDTIKIRSPNSLRPWQHVLECVSGYLTLTATIIDKKNNPKDFEGPWNFGPYDENIVDVEYLVKDLINKWGSGKYIIQKDNNFHEAKLLKLDISKSTSNLDWKPILNFENSIDMTVQWYKNYFNDYDMFNFTNKQIENYIKKF